MTLLNKTVEGFSTDNAAIVAWSLGMFLAIEFVLLLTGKWLWNYTIPIIFPFVQEMPSIWHVLSLSLLVKMIMPH